MNISLRTRLLLRHAAVFAVGMSIFALLIWFGARQAMLRDVNAWLDGNVAGLEKFLQTELRGTGAAAVIEEAREYSTGLPEGSGMQILGDGGERLFERGTRIATAQSVERDTIIEGRGYRLILWRSLHETERSLSRLSLLMAGLAPLVLLLSLAGGWWITRRALQPVDQITEAARRIGLQNLSERLPTPPHRDELRRLAEAWNEMLARLDASSGRLSRFTADASHELRTPVAVIRAAAELALRHERSPEEYRRTLGRIAEQSGEMTTMIETLLELARADAGRGLGPFAAVPLRALIERECEQWRGAAQAKGVAVESDLRADAAIVGNAPAIKRLIAILLDNAVKFTPAGGRVRVSLTADANTVETTVEDSGIGIAPEHLPRIFDRFYQADPSRSGGSSGLGLSLAQSIVTAHGGAIRAESALGQGARFVVTFPSAESDRAETANPGRSIQETFRFP